MDIVDTVDAYFNVFFGGLLVIGTIVAAARSRVLDFWTIVIMLGGLAVVTVALLYLQGLVASEWLLVSYFGVYGIVSWFFAISGFSAESKLSWTKWSCLIFVAVNVLWWVVLRACLL